MSEEVKVNAEGKELVLRNSAGDYAIIPKNRRAEVMKMLEDKCYGCIDSVVASLPKTGNEGKKDAAKKTEYAQEGLEVEEEEISEEVSFGEAFAKARREKGAGQTFEWRGGTYSTNYAIEPEETQREAIEPVEVTVEAEPVVSSISVPEEGGDTTLSTLELQPIDTNRPEEEESAVEEVVTEDVEEVVPAPVEDPILDEFSEEDEVGDERSFSEAFREARERLGAGQVFEWRGGKYTTNYAEEEEGLEFSDEEDTLVEGEGQVESDVEGGIEFSDESIEGGDIQYHIDKAFREFDRMSDSEAFIEYVNTYPERFGATETSEKLRDDTMKKFNEHQAKKISNKSEEEIADIVDKAMEEFEGVSDSDAFRLYVNTYPEEFGMREASLGFINEAMEKFNEHQAKKISNKSEEEGASVEEVEGNEEFIEKWGGARVAGPGRRVIPLERQRDEAIKEGRQAIIPELYRRSLIKGAEALGYDMEDEETRKIVEGLLKKYEEQGVSGVEYQKELRELLYKNPKAIRTALRQ